MARQTAILAIRAAAVLLALWLCGVGPEWWLAVPLFFFPGSACCGTTVGCGTCAGSGDASFQVQIDISGFTNHDCTNCSSYNGTFILSWNATTPICQWDIAITPYCTNYTNLPICSASSADVQYILFQSFSPLTPGGTYTTRIGISNLANGSAPSSYSWVHNHGTTKPDCLPPTSDSIGPPSGILPCFSQPSDIAVSLGGVACDNDGSNAVVTFL